ncbi:MAG: NADH-quinone oxidoreductase subunit L [Chitinophagaceae bacterium]|nr:NADH-quinone oxidoreductase subunit L [Chitinophagaceae bacterium]
MQNNSPVFYLIPLLPLIGFLINGLGRRILSKTAIALVGSGVVLGSFLLSLLVFFQVKSGSTFNPHYFTIFSVDYLTVPFAFKIDPLSSLFLLIITGVGFLIHVYSAAYMHHEDQPHYGRYFSYLNLFVFFMLLLVLGSNFVVLFIGWEGVGLCSYLLIGYWFKNQDYTRAANKAFIMNRIGDVAFLVALFWMITKFHSVTFSDVLSIPNINAKLKPVDITIITLLLFIGATGKSAQIPLYTWLPDAMAGPTPVSALIHAATMVTAGIYMVARCSFLYNMAPVTQQIVASVGIVTALTAATIALKQFDIKKVLAYSTVSQLGFMFLALGSGAYVAAVFHVMTHAFFKALLFLGSGSVIHAMGGEQDIRNMGGLKQKLKITWFTFLTGCIAIAGIPPLSGFFSKDAILLGAYLNDPLLYGLALIGAMLTAFYMFRLLFITFHGEFRGTEHQKHHLHESPPAMTIPLIILAVLSAVGGWIGIPSALMHGGDRITGFLEPSVVTLKTHHLSHSKEYLLMALSSGVALISVFVAGLFYRNYKPAEVRGFGKVLENKWYVDEFYDKLIVRPLDRLALWLKQFTEPKLIDGFINGIGKSVQWSSRTIRYLQSGQTGSYILLMVISMVVLLAIQFFVKK